MPTLEHICKRLFSDSSWFMKCVIGALLLAIPVAHFWAFGYLYELTDRIRRGEPLELPEWEEWRRLFVRGVPAFVIFLVLGLVPIGIGWLLTLPLRLIGYGALVYLPLAPALMIALPLVAAGLYQYQRREEYGDVFRPWVLLAMLKATKGYFWVPTLAMIGFLGVGYPLMTFTVFIGFAASWAFYFAFFRYIEQNRRQSLSKDS